MPINISLPNGRTVNVETKEGAKYFILYPGPFEFFSINLEHVEEVYKRIERRSNKRPTSQEIDEIAVVYATAMALAGNSDADTFAKIPNSEIECYMDHVIERMGIMSTIDDSWWVCTGKLEDMHEIAMIHGWMDLFVHRAPTALAFEKDFFGMLAKFVAAPPAVAVDDAESISMLVANAVITVWGDKEKEVLPSTESAFKKLESCGMLERFICLSTCPPFTSSQGVLKFYDELIQCIPFIKKKFANDQPCGKMALMMLNRPHIRQHTVVLKLRTIMTFANSSQQSAEVPSSLKDGFRMCRLCNKIEQSLEFQQSLKKCSRCKSAFYCSRECQLADWKSHKRQCKPVSKSIAKTNRFNENTMSNFLPKNYPAIMKEIVKVSNETGKGKCELLLELDFATPPGDGGMAPALKTPPEFKIKESKGYFEGERPNEPDWYYKNEDYECYRRNIKAITRALKDTYERCTNDHLLGFVRSPAGDTGCYRLQYQTPIGKHMFSEEAVSAARDAMYGDFGPLESLFGVESDNSRACMRKLRIGFGETPT